VRRSIDRSECWPKLGCVQRTILRNVFDNQRAVISIGRLRRPVGKPDEPIDFTIVREINFCDNL